MKAKCSLIVAVLIVLGGLTAYWMQPSAEDMRLLKHYVGWLQEMQSVVAEMQQEAAQTADPDRLVTLRKKSAGYRQCLENYRAKWKWYRDEHGIPLPPRFLLTGEF